MHPREEVPPVRIAFGKSKKDEAPGPLEAKIRRRMEILSRGEVLDYANTTLYEAGRALSAFENHGADPEAIEEARRSVRACLVVLDVLDERVSGAP